MLVWDVPSTVTRRLAVRLSGAAPALLLLAVVGCSDATGSQRPDGGTAAAPETPDGGTRFVDLAAESGIDFRMRFLESEQGANFKINLYDHGCGVAVADVDGDGDEDLYFSNQLGPNALLRNRGDGTFEDVTAQSGPVGLPDRISVAGVFADYDEDGDQDLYVTSTRGGNALFRNRGDGTFEDVTEAAGVTLVAHSQSPTFFDYDQDGDLDLFVTNTAGWTTAQLGAGGGYYEGKVVLFELVDSPGEPNVMYRNNGDGTFTDVTEELGLGGTSWGGDMAAMDIDQDGDQDLIVSNMFGAGKVYRNDGGKHFVDVRDTAFGKMSWGTIGIRVFDANNDALLDLVFADMHSDMWMPFDYPAHLLEPQRKYKWVTGRIYETDPGADRMEDDLARRMKIDYDSSVFGNTLFVNNGDGTFREVSDEAGVETFWPWGVAAGDFDNDGREDLYFPSGMGFPYKFWQSSLLRNVGDRGEARFVNITKPCGIALPPEKQHQEQPIGGRPATRSSRCAATADLNGDGLLDIVTNNFNDAPYYFVNRSAPRSYLKVRLHGTISNGDAIGSVVLVEAGGRTQARMLTCTGGYLSQSTRILHFGLGDATTVDRVEVRWPSGRTSEVKGANVNEVLELTEPGDAGGERR